MVTSELCPAAYIGQLTDHVQRAVSDRRRSSSSLYIWRARVCVCVFCRRTGAADRGVAESNQRPAGEDQKTGGSLRQRTHSQQGLAYTLRLHRRNVRLVSTIVYHMQPEIQVDRKLVMVLGCLIESRAVHNYRARLY